MINRLSATIPRNLPQNSLRADQRDNMYEVYICSFPVQDGSDVPINNRVGLIVPPVGESEVKIRGRVRRYRKATIGSSLTFLDPASSLVRPTSD